jgi:hypothetical protein
MLFPANGYLDMRKPCRSLSFFERKTSIFLEPVFDTWRQRPAQDTGLEGRVMTTLLNNQFFDAAFYRGRSRNNFGIVPIVIWLIIPLMEARQVVG